MDQFQTFIHKSRYARWRDDLGRREDWPETVQRYFDFFGARLKGNAKKAYKEIRPELEAAVLNLEVMPSMRCLMTAGPALERDEVAGYNCSYLPVDHPRAFDETMYILLCGTGVGFSVERQSISKLPEVPEQLVDTDTTLQVADSKIGWASAYKELLGLLWAGQIPKWDLSRIRPAGARLKVFGGRASGPDPLDDLFRFTISIFKKAQGRKLTSIECHDLMCKIGDVVVVGGVRRSALISLSNLSDDRMRHAKSGQWWETDPHRALANNSVVYTEKPDMGAFMQEWYSLYDSKSGERGIFYRKAARNCIPERRDPEHEWGTNPCCVSGDTPILTNFGYYPIEDLVDTAILAWNGEDWATVAPYRAGVAPLYRVSLSDGTHLDCTANHRWCINGEFVTTDNLEEDMALDKFQMPVVAHGLEEAQVDMYSQGFYAGDGNKGYNFSYIYAPKYACIPRLYGEVKDGPVEGRKVWKHGPMLDKTWVPLALPLTERLNWLAGLLDADGTVTWDKNGAGFQIASVEHEFLANVRLMLTTLGVQAKIVSGNPSGMREMPDGKGGRKEYYCQETKRLLIGNTDAAHLMKLGLKLSRLQHDGRKPQRDARRFVRVVSVEPLDRTEMTYCFTEPQTSRGTFNGIVTGNSEIILRPHQFCNLTEVVVRANDTQASLKRKARLATILGTLQSTLVNFRYLRKVWHDNTAEERLLGVSLTGIMDNLGLSDTGENGFGRDVLPKLKKEVLKTNEEWAGILKIPVSAATTCVKPSGTVSQLVNSASGIHPRYSRYYIRTVRADKNDPLAKYMVEKGFPVEDDVTKPTHTWVFSFPVESPDGSVMRDEMSAIEQLEMWRDYQEFWCEHKPSITVYVRENEWLAVGAWVYDNFDKMSGVSFLPHTEHNYRQAPYQEITEEQYKELKAKIPVVDWVFDEEGDSTTSSQEFACTSGACDIL